MVDHDEVCGWHGMISVIFFLFLQVAAERKLKEKQYSQALKLFELSRVSHSFSQP